MIEVWIEGLGMNGKLVFFYVEGPSRYLVDMLRGIVLEGQLLALTKIVDTH